ncbi:hypothetical protein EPK99_16175 [Neorhizobium lilium]|uniref:Uncharacterized protein n=1 Tax=Neorhizobium lilium TaxID=2503024 RepID=A0A3S3S5B6_9HYPH|nr:DUF6656 family protein [Neorhizobium lilium]RWX77184.1 hypothetical protein EPK99_16175 [Neorhizobium lilium]
MPTTGKLRYYDARQQSPPAVPPSKAPAHSEFLRTGRITRAKPIWNSDERRYLTYDEVAQRTGEMLEAAGDMTYTKINGFHRAIQFPKILFHRTLEGSPHLGYCHVTAAKTAFAPHAKLSWSFYIANFFSDIGEDDLFFERINSSYARMYFAVALEGEPGQPLQISRRIRKNGLLFKTSDPKQAMKNVLMLGAPDQTIREIIKSL